MKLTIFDKVLYRVPQFPLNTTLQKAWPELKRSIKDGSAYFYSIIKDLEFEEIAHQPQQVRFTIEKYFNRAKYRATPYGTFAGIGICSIGQATTSAITIAAERQEHHFVDWKLADQAQQHWAQQPVSKLKLQTNSSYYRFRNTFRYIFKNDQSFELSEMPYYPEIEIILRLCTARTPYSSLQEQADNLGLDENALYEIVTELIESQLLFTNYHPNIIGQDYFARTGYIGNEPDQEKYTLCTHKMLAGTLNKKDFNEVIEAIKFLHEHQETVEQNSDLSSFMEKFRQKYDMQAIPIMEALDPVIGIGYGDMESQAGTSDIVSKIEALRNQLDQSTKGKQLKQYLLEQMTHSHKRMLDIRGIKFSPTQKSLPLPNTLSAMVTMADQHVVVEHLGGATATSLLGRFSLIGGETHQLNKEMMAIEQASNPGVVFFDIAYMGEPTVDNVNRRLSIFEHELAICCWSENRNKVALNDILLQVQGSEIVLYSKRLNKRLIPRLATAYNYSRSDLPLFRLLCDIQSQGIITSIVPNLQAIMPDADHYPRLQYKNVVLARETWRIKYNNDFEQPENFNLYLQSINLSKFIKVGYADQTIRLNSEKQYDQELLFSILKARKELLITEVIQETNSVIKDSKENSFTSEFILSLYHKDEVYPGLTNNPYNTTTIQRNFPPGSEWIYFNLYCNNAVSNDILIEYLNPVLKKLGSLLSGWFFIRYNEAGDHIRLRLKPKDRQCYHMVFNEITFIISRLQHEGLLKDSQLVTYKREIERYAHAGMEAVENHFHIDSQYILQLIEHRYTDQQLYHIVSETILEVGNRLFEEKELTAIIKSVLHSFQKEHQTNPSIYKELNKAYRKADQQKHNLNSTLIDSFVNIINGCDPARRPQLLTDLFHMHINRLFAQQQRIHEFIIYEYLHLALKAWSRKAMASS